MFSANRAKEFNPFGLQMLYISSGLSLYFPWDFCLYPEATSLLMSAVQFITPATVLVAAITILVIKWRYNLRPFARIPIYDTSISTLAGIPEPYGMES